MTERLDCIVVGGGPGGLTAATYLARYRRSVRVFDTGCTRAGWIPKSRNCPGFPHGVGGEELLQRMRDQALKFDVETVPEEVTALHRIGDGFRIRHGETELLARHVILATGCEDVTPSLDGMEKAIECGAVRMCPICDAYEAIDTTIAVHGPADKNVSHARFLRTYSAKVTLVPSSDEIGDDTRAQLARDGIELTSVPTSLVFDGERCVFALDGAPRAFDVVYPMLGLISRSSLAVGAGAECDEDGALIVDAHQMTSVDGLYAIGDVVSALNQISVATGHAAIAATDVHNRLGANFA
ncbi:NAD(P)/FAD-dependent oxidoreductase [Lysobacter auxotrophicus]|uniref:NAD(P)/FAD-dependent oxidoreductase n=1 Tax=Lysobacter auxotrophicus TaxID=2992573 RepID=A0ABM8DEB4_9GAMM|nr:NAD(P)/FAD-dependent oxidoreductase [Lysobacter auxotrophicus]BDU16942.1 NAD(P)/FAD-dependent oxidoreductase [Lysobacter auxotrophicus]